MNINHETDICVHPSHIVIENNKYDIKLCRIVAGNWIDTGYSELRTDDISCALIN